MYGCEIVWPRPIGSAASAYASERSPSDTKSSRGTLSIARKTRSSTMSRPRSCTSTIARRASSASGCTRELLRVRRRLDAEMPQGQRREISDPAWRGVEPDGDDRYFRVARGEPAVTPAADVGSAAEVGELDSWSGRDEQLARIRVV